MGIEEAVIATGALTAATIVARPPALIRSARELTALAPGGARGIAVAALALLALAFATRDDREVEPWQFLSAAGATSIGLVALHALAMRCGGLATRTWEATQRCPWSVLATGVAIGGVAIGTLVLDRIPHVSDEIAYQFQARTYAAGRLWLPTPPLVDRFELPHVLVDGERWYGIFPPGWPALLAAGLRAGAPWLVNPLLAFASLGLFAALTRRAGLAPAERAIAVATLTLAPCFVVQAATLMSHLASLFLLLLLWWAVAGLLERGGLVGRLLCGLLAGGALAGGLLVRSFDFVAAGAPLGAWLAWRSLHGHGTGSVDAPSRGRAIAALLFLAIGGALGVALTLAYQRELTGDPLTVPAVRYFEAQGSGRFGVGFGADMGTTDHGPEWPGYWPSDVPRVSGHRLIEWFRDTGNAPLALLLLAAAAARRAWRDPRALTRVVLASGAAVITAYALHFYHGIAYGARHWFLALPAFAIAVGTTLGSLRVELASRLWLTLLLHALLLGLAPRLHEYAGRYRGVSGELRDASAARRAAG